MGDKEDVGLRMGTKVQCKSYSPEYYSMRDLNEDASSSSWSLCYEDRTLKSRPYHNCFLPRPTIDGYVEYDKEILKQTMLQQEAIFRKQVFELHHLYRRQRDLMDEFKRKELHKYPIPMTASRTNPLSSLISSENAQKMWQITSPPLVNLACATPSILCADKMQSPSNFLKESDMQAIPVPTQNGGNLQDHEWLEYKSKKVSRKGFDLQLPASEYLDCEEGEQVGEEKNFLASETESYCLKRNFSVSSKSDVKPSPSSVENPSFHGGTPKSDLSLCKGQGLADLNEPAQVEEATVSAPVNFLGFSAYQGEIQDQELLAKPNSVFLGLPGDVFQHTLKGRDNGIHVNVLPLENGGKSQEWSSSNLEAGLSRSMSSSQGFCPEKMVTESEPIQDELKTANELPSFLLSDHSRRKPWREREICGIEISERCQNLSNNNYVGPVLLPCIPSSYPSVPKSDAISGSSSISFWINPRSSLSLDPVAAQARSCLNTSAPLSKSSEVLKQSPRLKSASNSSFGSEVSHRNGFFHQSHSESTASNVRFPSVGFDYLNSSNDNNSASEHLENDSPTKYFRGSNCTDVKSAKDMNLNLALLNVFQDRMGPKRDLVVIDGEGKNEDLSQGLPWLKTKPACNSGTSKGRGGFNQVGLDLLQGYSQQITSKIGTEKCCIPSFIQEFTSGSCANVAEPQRIEVGNCSSNRKILGFPIFDKPLISKDQCSFSSSSKSLQYPYEVEDIQNCRKVGILNIDLSCDPALPDSDQCLSSKNQVVDKGLGKDDSGSMYHINLNSCMNEEEAPSTAVFVPRTGVKVMSEIDLEAPVAPEAMEGISPVEDSSGNQLETPGELSLTGEGQPDELVRVAAEVMVIMASSHVHNHLEDAICHPLEASLKDSLHWFAEIVTSKVTDPESEVGAVLRGKGSSDHDEFSDGIDCFESMTLKLTETKVHECYKPWVPENQKEEETGTTLLQTRRRRGQARRGRQRKDFQRDILPGLVSLSRHEVTEDLVAFEGLMRATGHPWQTALGRRNVARNGWARGRRRSRGPDPTMAVSTECSPPKQQPNNIEVGLEEGSLKGWGKTTRRPRRQRIPAGTPIPLTQA